MAQVFDNAYSSVKNIVIDGMLVYWAEEDKTGNVADNAWNDFPLMLTGVQIQYQRQAVPYNTLNIGTNGSQLLQIMSRPTGIMTVQTAISSGNSSLDNFLKKAGTTCGKGICMMMSPTGLGDRDTTVKDCIDSGMTYAVKGAFLTSFNVSAQAGSGQIAIADSITISFASLAITRERFKRPDATTLEGAVIRA